MYKAIGISTSAPQGWEKYSLIKRLEKYFFCNMVLFVAIKSSILLLCIIML